MCQQTKDTTTSRKDHTISQERRTLFGTGTNGEPFHVLVLGVELRLELAVHFPHRQLARLQSRQVIESELGTTYRETSIAYSACGTSIANACVRI